MWGAERDIDIASPEQVWNQTIKNQSLELAGIYRRALNRDVVPIESKKPPIFINKHGIPVFSVHKQKRPEPPKKWKLVIPSKPRKKWQPAKRPESYRMDSSVYYLIEEWGHVCSYCGRIDLRLTADHVIPKSRPGGAQLRGMGHDNMVPACQRCNGLKGAKTPLEWLMEGVLR